MKSQGLCSVTLGSKADVAGALFKSLSEVIFYSTLLQDSSPAMSGKGILM